MTALLTMIGHAVVAAAAVIWAAPLWFLPWRAALTLGRWYGYTLYVWHPPSRRTAQINLRRVYGSELTRAEARWQTLQVLGSVGQAMAEGLQFARRHAGGAGDWNERFDVEAPDLVAQVVNDPRPKIFVTAHLGSWEMALMVANLRFGGGAAMMRRVDNPFIERLLRWARQSPTPLIDKRGGVAAAVAHVAGGGSVGMLLDENAGHKGVPVNFFGRPASTYRLAALLSARSGYPIVVGAAVRRSGGRYLYRLAIVEPAHGANVVTQLTQDVTTVFERWIREDPLQWRWIHWRWKTRPDGTEERYTAQDLRECFATSHAQPEWQGDTHR